MAKLTYPRIAERRDSFTKVWLELAPSDSFAGMTVTQFTASTEGTATLRNSIETTRTQLASLLQQRDLADVEARKSIKMVINAVRGDPQHGENSPLYRALGYIPTSARSNGLTRTKAAMPKTPATNTNVA
jgi:hypothetical protein